MPSGAGEGPLCYLRKLVQWEQPSLIGQYSAAVPDGMPAVTPAAAPAGRSL